MFWMLSTVLWYGYGNSITWNNDGIKFYVTTMRVRELRYFKIDFDSQ